MVERTLRLSNKRIKKGLCPCGVNKHKKHQYYCSKCRIDHRTRARKISKKRKLQFQELEEVKSLLLDISQINEGVKGYIN